MHSQYHEVATAGFIPRVCEIILSPAFSAKLNFRHQLILIK